MIMKLILISKRDFNSKEIVNLILSEYNFMHLKKKSFSKKKNEKLIRK